MNSSNINRLRCLTCHNSFANYGLKVYFFLEKKNALQQLMLNACVITSRNRYDYSILVRMYCAGVIPEIFTKAR